MATTTDLELGQHAFNPFARKEFVARSGGRVIETAPLEQPVSPAVPTWLHAMYCYMFWMFSTSVVWGIMQIPLYADRETASQAAIWSVAVRGIADDIMTALGVMIAALFTMGNSAWPDQGFRRVAVTAIALGLGYVAFAEWVSFEAHGTTAYGDLVPVVPGINVGAIHLLQWLLLPAFAFWRVGRMLGGR